MSQHTPEPWHVSGRGKHLHIGAMTSPMVLASMNDVHTRTEENARRIVACVNACANIPLEHLEQHGHEFLGFYVQQREVELIIQKRDQLQNAVNEIKKYIADYPYDMGLEGFAKSVIAKIGAEL